MENQILKLNKDNNINGILLQLPIPIHINIKSLFGKISALKDVDGLSALSLSSNVNRFIFAISSKKSFYPICSKWMS